MQKALWKGAISFGLVHIPVQLYAADNSHDLDLDMIDKRDFSPVGYKRINKKTGKEVTWENIVKAYEFETDQYVVLSPEDLKRANAKATGTIDIFSFADADQVPLIYYERPYFLTPDKGGDKVYALLREILKRSKKIAIAQIVIRTKQHLAALLPLDGMIVLNTLRYADEIRPVDQFEVPKTNLKQVGISEKEIQMALSLVEGMTEKWDASQYHDTYREDVYAMIKKKVKANQTKTITEPEEDIDVAPKSAKIIDLMALLKQSVNRETGHTDQSRKPARTSSAKASSASAKRRTATSKPGTAISTRGGSVKEVAKKTAKRAVAPRRARA